MQLTELNHIFRSAAFLLLLGSACGKPPEPTFKEARILGCREVSAAVLNQGERLFALHCSSCHGADGSGQGPAARAVKKPPRDFRMAEFPLSAPEGGLPSHEALVSVIAQGSLEAGMPAWKAMQPTDLEAMANYIKTFSPAWNDASCAEIQSAQAAPDAD